MSSETESPSTDIRETDSPTPEQQSPQELQSANAEQGEQGPEVISVLREQYEALLNRNMVSVANTLNTLDLIDSLIATHTNILVLLNNKKDEIKREQLRPQQPKPVNQ